MAVKQRSAAKGLIILAANYSQLLPYIDDGAMNENQRLTILSRWPGAVTQLLPINKNISSLLCGNFNTIAVRITNHPVVVALCDQINKAIISTSANLSGQPAAATWQQVKQQFPNQLDYIIQGQTLGLSKPSSIINGLTGEIVRP